METKFIETPDGFTAIENEGELTIFCDLGWGKFYAPVVPPTQVLQKLKESKEPVYWQNGIGKWLMLYYTEYEGNEIVTHLRIGSVQPTEGWLARSSLGYERSLWESPQK